MIRYRLACWWLDSPRVDRVRQFVYRKAAAHKPRPMPEDLTRREAGPGAKPPGA